MTMESLAQSLQHLSLTRTASAEHVEIPLDDLDPSSAVVEASQDVFERGFAASSSSAGLSTMVCPPPPPPLPPRAAHPTTAQIIERFCQRWSIVGVDAETTQAVLHSSTANHRVLLISTMDRLGRYLSTGTACSDALQLLFSMHGSELMIFSRDAEYLLKAMLGCAEAQCISVLMALHTMQHEARNLAMEVLRTGILTGATSSEAARLVLAFTCMGRNEVKELRTYCRGLKSAGSNPAEQRAVCLAASVERPDLFIAFKLRAEREALTQQGYVALLTRTGMQEHFVPKVLARAHHFLNDAHAHAQHIHRALDHHEDDRRTLRAHAFDGLRQLRSRFKMRNVSADDKRAVVLFAAAWFLCESHPSDSATLRLALAQTLACPPDNDWDLRQAVLMVLEPAFADLGLHKLSASLNARTPFTALSASQSLLISQRDDVVEYDPFSDLEDFVP